MKVDTGLINGFESMTAEQKVDALLGLDMDPTKLGFKTQESFDKIMSENADYKHRLRDMEKASKDALSASATEKDGMSAKLAELTEKYDALMREKQIAEDVGQFVAMGYSQELAKEAAEAYASNDRAKLFAVQTKFLAERDQKAKEDALSRMHGNQGGSGDQGGSEDNELLKFARAYGKQKAEAAAVTEKAVGNYIIK